MRRTLVHELIFQLLTHRTLIMYGITCLPPEVILEKILEIATVVAPMTVTTITSLILKKSPLRQHTHHQSQEAKAFSSGIAIMLLHRRINSMSPLSIQAEQVLATGDSIQDHLEHPTTVAQKLTVQLNPIGYM